MLLAFDADVTELTESVADYLDRRDPTAPDEEQISDFRAQAGRAGWLGLAVPEPCGGSGAGITEVAALLELLGDRTVPGPWLGTLLGSVLLTESACLEAGVAARLESIAEGRLTLGIGVPTRRAGDTDSVVFDGRHTEAYLQLEDDTLAVHRVSGMLPGRLFDLDACRVPAPMKEERLAAAPLAEQRYRHLLALLASVYSAGLSAGVLRLAVDHVNQRHQFGRPVGSFQAVKHRCAGMAARAEAARSSAYFALAAEGSATPERVQAAASACLITVDAAVRNAEEAIQLHGAMGYTWECRAHRYLRRARAVSALLPRAQLASAGAP